MFTGAHVPVAMMLPPERLVASGAFVAHVGAPVPPESRTWFVVPAAEKPEVATADW